MFIFSIVECRIKRRWINKGNIKSINLRFNSILAGGVYGYSKKEKLTFQCFKKRETHQECMAFWGNKEPEIV